MIQKDLRDAANILGGSRVLVIDFPLPKDLQSEEGDNFRIFRDLRLVDSSAQKHLHLLTALPREA